ncbi:outer membrane protein assembly factor BamB [Actinoplanes lutulentus]|uniref:Outer membrane protein assembly factor BamB n=1 Tax=Actinoplanes lutulentus TaxID=1287878 RepID=A0A327Z6K9_9ACTN|nr:PQQ-binding-like beta-propeller repeat protein [Actinoplanes lutulentus]MBB2946277.1 outer membrane protein assembly factor BamB [Actinoplanes lutulentus]RAK32964.1 outer membrane protein assembly factor BamB [Actinoplanes lutulentus]
MAVIELGDMTDARPTPAAGPITAGLDRRRIRQSVLFAVLLLVLACGGAVRPEPPSLRQLWTTPYNSEKSIVLSAEILYMVSGGDRAELEAFSLADGRRLWRWGTDAHLIGVNPAPGGGPVLVSIDPASAGTAGGPAAQASRTTVALRAGSGAELWRRAGEPLWQGIDRTDVMLTEFDPRGGIAAVSRVRIEDGEPIWTSQGTTVREAIVEIAGGRMNRVITRTTAGDVTVLRHADGTREAAARVAPIKTGYNDFTARDGRLWVAVSPDDGPTSVGVYRLDTLTETRRRDDITDCGTIICSWGQGGFVALDPGNGRELWRGPEIIASVVTDDRLLTDQQTGGEHTLLDSRTGRALSGSVHGWVAWADRWDDEVLLLRPSTEPIGRTSVTRIDLRTGRTALLGSLEPLPDQQSCRTTPGYLICTGWDRVIVAAVP